MRVLGIETSCDETAAAVLAELPALAGEAMGASTAELGERIAQVLREGSAPEVQGSLMVQLAQVRGMMGR